MSSIGDPVMNENMNQNQNQNEDEKIKSDYLLRVLMYFWSVLLRRKWVVGGLSLLAAFSVAIYVYSLPNFYLARGNIKLFDYLVSGSNLFSMSISRYYTELDSVAFQTNVVAALSSQGLISLDSSDLASVVVFWRQNIQYVHSKTNRDGGVWFSIKNTDPKITADCYNVFVDKYKIHINKIYEDSLKFWLQKKINKAYVALREAPNYYSVVKGKENYDVLTTLVDLLKPRVVTSTNGVNVNVNNQMIINMIGTIAEQQSLEQQCTLYCQMFKCASAYYAGDIKTLSPDNPVEFAVDELINVNNRNLVIAGPYISKIPKFEFLWILGSFVVVLLLSWIVLAIGELVKMGYGCLRGNK